MREKSQEGRGRYSSIRLGDVETGEDKEDNMEEDMLEEDRSDSMHQCMSRTIRTMLW